MLTGKVTDYVTTILPLALVRRAATILAEINDPRLDEFTLALESALVLSHKQRSLAAIVEALGDLGHGDALTAIAAKLTAKPRSPAAEIAMVWARVRRGVDSTASTGHAESVSDAT